MRLTNNPEERAEEDCLLCQRTPRPGPAIDHWSWCPNSPHYIEPDSARRSELRRPS